MSRPKGSESARFLSVGIELTSKLHAGKRLTYQSVADDYSVSKRTANRWIRAVERVLPLVKTTNGDGCRVFYLPTDRRQIGGP